MSRQVIRYSEAFKLQVISELESGKLSSIFEAQRRYGIRGGQTVQNWLKKYGRNHLMNKIIKVQTPKDRDEVKELKKRIRELITRPALLWITVFIGLAMLWWPVLQGVLQGRQNFLWLGWLQIFNGVGRFLAVLVFVTLLGWNAVGAVTAALIGFWAAVGLALWQTGDILREPGAPVDWRGWLARVIPLSLGLGASQFVMAADQLVVQSVFDKSVTGFYGAAGTIGRALVFFTIPMVAVMFPKIVRSAALAEDTSVMKQALGVTALMGGGAALACTLFPKLPLWLMYEPEYLQVAPLVPWFAWCMLPLTLANVLIGNLLARQRFRAVPWLVLVAAGYGVTLVLRGPSFQAMPQMAAFRSVVLTLGAFSTLLLGVSVWFTWGGTGKKSERM